MKRTVLLIVSILFLAGSDIMSQTAVENVYVVGNLTVGSTLTGYYTTSGGSDNVVVLSWYQISPRTYIGGASDTYRIESSDLGKNLYFKVAVFNGTGDLIAADSSGYSPAVIANSKPVAKVGDITGSTYYNVNDVLTGNYEYSDVDGDIEDGSRYEWWRSRYSDLSLPEKISDADGISYKITLSDTGRYIFFKVTPVSKTGDNKTGDQEVSDGVGRVNTPPYAYSVTVQGDPYVNSELTGHYHFYDRDGSTQGATLFRWFRNRTTPIQDAVEDTYLLTSADEGYKISFEVTPVSNSGDPATGITVPSSNETAEISYSSSDRPFATEVCIDGNRAVGTTVTGVYLYNFPNNKKEGTSIHKWYRNGICIDSTSGIYYTLTQADMDQDIAFEVTPVSSNNKPRIGDPVMSHSLPRITLLKDNFYATDKDTTLTAVPDGGYFWGTGVLNGKFSPKLVDYKNSPFIINYHLDDNSCSQDASKIVFVKGVNMYFESLKTIYCQNGGLDTIYAKNIPLGYSRTFRMTDTAGFVKLIGTDEIVIDPRKMRAGSKIDTLFFRADSTGRSIEIFQPLIIDSIAQVSILNLKKDTALCNNMSPFPLFVSQPRGVFSGPVKDGSLDPSMALGVTEVTYTYTTRAGCVSSVSVPVTINPSPVASFAAKDYCIENSTDTTRFINKTSFTPLNPVLDSINKWHWTFYNLSGSDTSTLKEPGYLYTKGSYHKVILSATSVNNCTSQKDSTIDLGVKPIADFYWIRECFKPNDLVILKDTTSSESDIASRTWIFPAGIRFDRGAAEKSQGFLKEDSGYINVEYIVRTYYNGCHDTVSKSIYIRPTVSLSKDDYFQDFEKGKKGWVKDYESHNTWSFGTPSRAVITKAASGLNGWFTNFATDTIESSSIISPCFDFDSIQRPMIKVKLWRRFDMNRDGAALQYRIGDEKEWQNVGTLDDGIKWYNSTLIKGKPGGQQIGWTAGAENQKDADWIESRHELDELMGKQDVKFRIAYGSDGTARENDGLAFDDIWIGSRTRGVLLEHYTNNMSSDATTATARVTELALKDTVDIINIQYHTNFPGSGDPYYNDNPGDASARILFYGLTRTPYSFIDGGTGKNYANIFDYRPTPLDSPLDNNDLKRRSLINPYFQITLNTTVSSNGELAVSGQVKALEAITNAENVTLYIAVTEKKSVIAPSLPGGETEFFNVLRKFIPDAGGINLKKSWAKDDIYPISKKTWIIEKIRNGSDIEVIAFIQNNITKEIYQAESNRKHNIVVGIDNLFMNNGKGFSIYPNPASGRLTIEFEESLPAETEILIYDFKGTIVRSYKTGFGQAEYSIPDIGLNSGIYLVRIKSGAIDWGFKKLIITGN